jgi:putative ABC transport system substrate-binding protein
MALAFCALVLILTAVPLTAQAQPPKSTARVGYLSSTTAEAARGFLAAFRQGLREQGYGEDKNMLLEQRYAGGRYERLPALAAELVDLKVDVLVVGGAPAARAAKTVTNVIPIVMAYVADPVGIGLVANLARPGGNVTGLSDFNAGVVVKRLELLKELVPKASRIAVLLNPANPTHPLQLKLMETAAPILGVTLLTFEATRVDQIDRVFAAMAAARPGALVQIGDPFLGSQQRKILDLVAKIRLPAIYSTRTQAEQGGLMAYGTDFEDLHRRAAVYVAKILNGARPGDLPVEQPTKFELLMNLKTAHALGLRFPPSLLLRADRVLE